MIGCSSTRATLILSIPLNPASFENAQMYKIFASHKPMYELNRNYIKVLHNNYLENIFNFFHSGLGLEIIASYYAGFSIINNFLAVGSLIC